MRASAQAIAAFFIEVVLSIPLPGMSSAARNVLKENNMSLATGQSQAELGHVEIH